MSSRIRLAMAYADQEHQSNDGQMGIEQNSIDPSPCGQETIEVRLERALKEFTIQQESSRNCNRDAMTKWEHGRHTKRKKQVEKKRKTKTQTKRTTTTTRTRTRTTRKKQCVRSIDRETKSTPELEPSSSTIPSIPNPSPSAINIPPPGLQNLQKKSLRCSWPQCNRIFTCNHNLHQHVREKHTNERPFQCTLCEQRGTRNAFNRPFVLYRHLRHVHGIQVKTGRGRKARGVVREDSGRETPAGQEYELRHDPEAMSPVDTKMLHASFLDPEMVGRGSSEHSTPLYDFGEGMLVPKITSYYTGSPETKLENCETASTDRISFHLLPMPGLCYRPMCLTCRNWQWQSIHMQTTCRICCHGMCYARGNAGMLEGNLFDSPGCDSTTGSSPDGMSWQYAPTFSQQAPGWTDTTGHDLTADSASVEGDDMSLDVNSPTDWFCWKEYEAQKTTNGDEKFVS